MPQIDDPFRPADATVASAASGVQDAQARGSRRLYRDGRRRAHQTQSRCRRPGGRTLAPVSIRSSARRATCCCSRGSCAARSRRLMSPACGGTRSTRSASSRSARVHSGAANETVLAARYALCATLDEAVLLHAVGRAERVGAADAARLAASRGVGRREVLRDARAHFPGSRAPHRA